MAYSIRCPICREKWPWDPTSGFPEFCKNPKCESRIAHDRADDDIVLPFIRHAATSASDKVYRDMERGSEVRAAAAAEMTGASVAEMSGLKITDLRETRHEGAIAAPPLPAHLANVGSWGGAQASEYSGHVQQGPFPNAGARAQSMLRQEHGQRVGWDKLSERPAEEVRQPGYRRRT